MKRLYILSLSLFLSIVPLKCFAVNSSDVVINEIAWMGATSSANDEWIELYNNTTGAINFVGWVLKADDGTPEIKLSGSISANGFYLLERTDDNSVPGITADKIYTGALGNNGENLKLYDNLNNVVDEVNCSSGWFAGNNTIKQTMERIARGLTSGKNASGWQTSENPGGTPKSQNSVGAAIKTEPTPTPQNSPELATGQAEPQKPEENKPAEIGSPPTYPDGIIFNEILPSPEGPDETEEWIEIFNQNDFEVVLSDWQIKDSAGKITTFTFPAGAKILAKGFFVLNRPTTKITLNNDEDSLTLLQPDDKIVNTVAYKKAPLGQSYNKIGENWQWSATLTPGAANAAPENKKTALSEAADTDKNPEAKTDIGSLANSLEAKAVPNKSVLKISSNSKTYAIAVLLALFSGAVILILKKSLTNKVIL